MDNRFVLLFILLFCPWTASAEDFQANKDAIKIATNNWTSQIVLSHISGGIFQYMGYKVQYLHITAADQWGALAHGVIDVQVEVWEGTMAGEFQRMVAKKRIDDVGNHDAKTREEWWYPDYVEPLCPGLPDWKALRKCASIFSRPGFSGKGVYFAGPWEKQDRAKIRALQMDFKVHVLANSDLLLAELEKAVKNKQPIILSNWTPSWEKRRYTGQFVEFPEYSPQCESDPSWGINKKYLFDCGSPKDGFLKKAAWSGMKSRWNCAYKTLQNINFDNKQIVALVTLVDVGKLSHKRAAMRWLNKNEAVWKQWIAKDCTL